MLKSILSPETCAKCRNCCVFVRESAWELPTFSAAAAKRLPPERLAPVGDRFRYTLEYGAEEDGTANMAQPCPFLDVETGCTLPPEEKPFACSIWPLRVMESPDGGHILTLYQGCAGMPYTKLPALRKLLAEGLQARIESEVVRDPSLVLPYHPKYRCL